MTARSCSACATPIEPPPEGRGFTFCAKCGAPALFGNALSPFDVFGAQPGFALDEAALEKRYHELSRRLHPDRHTAALRSGANKGSVLEFAALLNRSYLAIKRPEERLETLLEVTGLVSAAALERKTETKSQIPAELAEEYFELQELFMDDPTAGHARVTQFQSRLENENSELTRKLHHAAEAVDWTSNAAAADGAKTENILELRRQRSYVRSMLTNLERFKK